MVFNPLSRPVRDLVLLSLGRIIKTCLLALRKIRKKKGLNPAPHQFWYKRGKKSGKIKKILKKLGKNDPKFWWEP